MKNVITALLVTTFALGLSSSVRATTCKDIGKSVVDNYVAVAGYSVQTETQVTAYNSLVETQVDICRTSVQMRKRGASPESAAKVILSTANGAARTARTNDGVVANSMSQMSASLGYAFGE